VRKSLAFSLYLSWMVIGGQAFADIVSLDSNYVAGQTDMTTKLNADRLALTNGVNNIRGVFAGSAQSSGQIKADTIGEENMADDANPRIRTNEGAGCPDKTSGMLTTTTSGTLLGSIPAGVSYPDGYRVEKTTTTAKTWTASKWTYYYILTSGSFDYQEVTIGAARPSDLAGSATIARVSTDGTQVVAVQDLRTTSCATGTFAGTFSTSSGSTLDDMLKVGPPVRRFSPAGRTPVGHAQGAFVSWDSHTTFKVTPGALYINGRYRFVSSDITVTTGTDTPSSGLSGLDTGTVTGGPLKYYVYGVADQDDVTSYSVTYSTNATTPTGLTNYRLIGSVNTDATNLFTSRDNVTVHTISEREIVGGWVHFDGQGSGTILNSYNVASILENAAGDYSISWDSDFVNATYYADCTHSQQGSTTNGAADSIQSLTAGVARFNIKNVSDAAVDGNPTVCIGVGDTRR